MKIFVDVNIFIYAAGRPHAFKEPSTKLIHRIGEGREDVTIDTEVLQELLYRYWQAKAVDEGLRLCEQAMRLGTDILPVG